MKASQVIAIASDELNDGGSRQLLQDSIDAALLALQLADSDSRSERSKSELQIQDTLRINTLLSLSISYDHLGAHDEAVDTCRKALAIEPNNLNALMLLGWLKSDAASQVNDRRFQRDLHLRLASQLIALPVPHEMAA
jgi:tetratricopeptide (TPR) repeat protein